ncbi:EpsG family protein [Providencia alcalifaciens]|uniref:EpsG family protein n=1 Tax=Providencia alcalifaciens TaxID=126385 RepID=UPI0032DAAA41
MTLFIPYYLIITLFLFILGYRFSRHSTGIINLSILLLLLIFFLSVGYRDFNFKGDTSTYLWMYESLTNNRYNGERIEKGFIFLLKLLSFLNFSQRDLLLFIAILQSLLWFWLIKLTFKNYQAVLIITLLIISSFFVYNMGGNLLRQGIAVPLALISLELLTRKKILLAFTMMLLALFFHVTSLVYVISFLFISFIKLKLRYYLIFLFMLSIASLSGLIDIISLHLPALVPSYQHIFTNSAFELYKVGFRLDFWLFTMIPIFLYFCLKGDAKIKYEKTIKIYIFLFYIFIVLFSFPYSDRFGLYLWSYMLIILTKFYLNYRFNMGNSFTFYIILIACYGSVSYALHSLMNFGYDLGFIL